MGIKTLRDYIREQQRRPISFNSVMSLICIRDRCFVPLGKLLNDQTFKLTRG
jgi:hypothetical protein